jgi:multidrug resistance protein, MATE family
VTARRLGLLGLVLACSRNIGNGILRGVGDDVGPFRISLMGYWLVGLPAGYLLGVTAGHGVQGVWIGQISRPSASVGATLATEVVACARLR